MADLTFLFTDVVGSTKRWETDADAMAAALAEHDAAIAAAVAAHRGTLLKTKGEGDSTVSVFDRATDALAAAADAQRAVALPVRMAVHTGPAEARDGDYFGPTLNRAARLRAIAHGGQVICSEAAAFASEGTLADGLDLIGVGVHRLKDLAAPEYVLQLSGEGLAADFPPLLSLNRATTNLPAQQSSFIGRVDELAHVRSLITKARLVTLIGTGGSGKTRLSLEAAAASFDEFPDGVWFCELAPISDGAAVANVVAAAVNVALMPGDPTAQVVAALADKAALVVLDNCEHVVEGAAQFAAALLSAAPNMRLVATSRERLRVAGESAWTVPQLSLPQDDALARTSEAVQLFLERAALVAPALDVHDDVLDDVIAICRRVEAVPLAIELAAARVRMMSVADLRSRLEQHWDILSGGDRDALPHQRSLRATIEWSHSLLSLLAQGVLHRLAVFRGGFELPSAERLLVACDIGENEALDAVQDLVDKSLVDLDQDSGRYRILETVREYALEQLEAAGLAEETRRAHAAHLVEVIREAEERILCVNNQRTGLLRVADEYDNIAAALTWSLEHDHVLAGQIIGYSFGPWYGLGQPEAAMWYRRLLPVIDELEGETASRACNAVGVILGYLGEKEIALPLLDRAVAIARTIDDVELLPMALSLNASVRQVHDDDLALALTREALSIPITSPRAMLRAWILQMSAWIFWELGMKQEAREAIIEADKLCVEHDDHLIRLSVLGGIAQMAPDYMTTDQAFAAAVAEGEWLRQSGVAEDAAAIETAADGRSLIREGRWAEALEVVERLLAMPQPRMGFDRHLTRAALMQLLDQPDAAVRILEQLVAEASNAIERNHALSHLASARRDVGDMVGSEAARSETLRYLLDEHNPGSRSGRRPAVCVGGWMLLLRATLLVESNDDEATISRLLGVAYGLLDQEAVPFELELACALHGYEDRLPKPEHESRAFAAGASLAEALAYLDRV